MKSLARTAEVKTYRTAILRALARLALVVLTHAPLTAQSRFFPDVPSFELPLASPRAAGFSGRLIQLSRGESQFGAEREADVALGETFPVLALRKGATPVTLSFGAQVYGRFSLDDSRSSMISSDWTVGFDLHTARNAWEVALQLFHESSHLGDEYASIFDARRIDWTREVLMGWVGYRPGRFRVLAGAGRALVDELEISPWLTAVGVDFRGGAFSLLGQDMVPIAGIFVDARSATEWRVSSDLKLGLAIPGAKPGREFHLSLVRHAGLSTQRQFYQNDSRYLGLELEFQLW